MDLQNKKCVMVIDENLPLGIIANTAAIMGITIGKQMPEVVGADVYDRTGNGHLGIIEFPVPILKGNVGFRRGTELFRNRYLWCKKEGQQINREHGIVEIVYNEQDRRNGFSPPYVAVRHFHRWAGRLNRGNN